MADNILKGIIRIEAPGLAQTTNQVAQAVGKTEQSLKRLAPAGNEATGAMINLGRVVQDAPFGFLGIANNLNPLIESFQRTNKAAGGFRGTLKALGSSLVGAGGISLAVSAVSTGLILFGDKLFGTSKAAKEADEATQKLAQNLASQAVKLTALVGIVQNVNSSYDDKKKALQAINQEYKTYLDALGKEEVTAGNVADAYERIIDSLIRQAVVKGLQEEISKLVEETAKKIIALEKAEEKRRITTQGVADATSYEVKSTNELVDALKGSNRVTQDGILAQGNYRAEVEAGIRASNTYENRLKAIKDELFSQLSPVLKLTENFEDLDIKINKVTKNLSKKIPPLQLQVSFSEPGEIPDLTELTADVLKVYNRAGGVLGKEFLDGFKNTVSSEGAEGDAGTFLAQNLEKQFAGEFKKFGLNFFSTAKIDLTKSFFVNSENITKQLQQISKGFAAAQLTADFASTSFNAAFDALLNGQNAIEAIGNALKQLVADLIKATIQTLILKAVTNLLLPGLGAAGGAVPGLPGSAGPGGIAGLGVTGFGVAGGGVSAIGGLGLGGPLQISGQLVGRGNDLVAVISSASRQNGRIG